MTKILAFSDVHLNLGCVRKLRAQEKNSFDAVVIAGDMGSEAVPDLLSIVSTFDCPVYYVYGNWDNQLGYEERFGDQFHLLHLQVETVGELFITGFSGCPTHWGNNPISLQLNEALQKKYSALLTGVKNAFDLALAESEPISQQHQAIDKRKTGNDFYIPAPFPSDPKSERKKKAIWKNYESLKASPEYKTYLNDALLVHKEIEQWHRQCLYGVLKNSKIDVARLMLITHERMHRIHEEEVKGLGFHLFGHRHGFKRTLFKGTNYVNVSALDNVCFVVLSGNYYNVNAGTYCVIDFRPDDQSSVQCKRLYIPEGLELIDWRMSDIWLPSEEQFL
ncbi:MAG: hypothetical protein GW769_17090 [Alphaproteobacteria bacterium]|uniref:Calcineurin-like phosphoesterase domain-containing protein n=1 Tax=Candidatus Dojkabacteria bacterium CG_4_10_14_0_2_um_filter_Dojkabacteria_WS6_41_15 TaxID=2014249 RepID=A0A2M7W380_9BACT|nr:metallophosphoesterase family protein [Shewanella vesiculosa]NCP76498.1 hypothetical protein [Shewanella vesiculosa]NCT08452.1 hypothetical protein [Alphaproteobacteria bacterium]PJA14743.1 MAG: hypothetical protein COX64_01665 [Candidatus Dojkabacteria bacterium CG_4_10_14_0_2_um_filter_Dojkabacteria_WS6_41_15]